MRSLQRSGPPSDWRTGKTHALKISVEPDTMARHLVMLRSFCEEIKSLSLCSGPPLQTSGRSFPIGEASLRVPKMINVKAPPNEKNSHYMLAPPNHRKSYSLKKIFNFPHVCNIFILSHLEMHTYVKKIKYAKIISPTNYGHNISITFQIEKS